MEQQLNQQNQSQTNQVNQPPNQPFQPPNQPFQPPNQPFQPPNQPFQQNYGMPLNAPGYPIPPYNAHNTAPLSTGQFILMYIVFLIPIVNIIMFFVWAFGENTNLNRKAFSRAVLIMCLLVIIAMIVLFAVFYNVIMIIINEIGNGFVY